MFAIVLAGGLGKRLLPYTETKPKPLVEIAGKPMVQHIMEGLKYHGVSHFLMMEDHMAEQIQDYFGDGSRFGIDILHLISQLSEGSIGAIKKGLEALPDSEKDCFVVTSDNISDVNFTALASHHRQMWEQYGTGPLITPVGVPGRYGIVLDEGLYADVVSRPLVHSGFWIAQKELKDFLPDDGNMIEMQKFPLGDIGKAFVHEGYWIDAGTPEDLIKANKEFDLWKSSQEGSFPVQARR